METVVIHPPTPSWGQAHGYLLRRAAVMASCGGVFEMTCKVPSTNNPHSRKSGAMGHQFAIYTRGRTGSTAVRSELGNHPDIVCHGEMFRPNVRYNPKGDAAYENQLAPYMSYRKAKLGPDASGEEKCYDSYLKHMIAQANQVKPNATVGFKLLLNHAQMNRGLLAALRRRDFVFLHLIRQNYVRQIISGMVAKERGVFNRKNWDAPEAKYHLDIERFTKKLKGRQSANEQSRQKLKRRELKHLEIYYEDFVEDRNAFFAPIFSFLGVENMTVAPTEFSVMTDRNLRNVVENYEELRAATQELGLEHMLEAT